MEYKDYYQILGVARRDDDSTIKSAYKRLARKYHPDVNHEAGAEEKFKDLQEAYDVLRDKKKRAAYDQLGADWKNGQQFRPPPGWNFSGGDGGGQGGFSDLFGDLFGGGGQSAGFGFDQGGFGGHQRPQAQTATLRISLEDAYTGASKTLRIGAGGRQVRVKIPTGVKQGQTIRLSGQGEQGNDLHLNIEFDQHRLFQLDDKNINIELPLAPWEAALGAKVQVPTLGGTIEMKIPAGSRSGQKLRLRGRGMPGTPAGDQFLKLQIQNPSDISDSEKELFEKLAETSQYAPRENLKP